VGRLSMASWQDKLKSKHTPYYLMAVLSLGICFATAVWPGNLPVTLAMMWIVNFFFGCGFSCLPNILHQHYSMKQLSTVLGLTLSAWAAAGLAGNQLALFVINRFDLSVLYAGLGVIYTIEFCILLVWVRNHSAKAAE